MSLVSRLKGFGKAVAVAGSAAALYLQTLTPAFAEDVNAKVDEGLIRDNVEAAVELDDELWQSPEETEKSKTTLEHKFFVDREGLSTITSGKYELGDGNNTKVIGIARTFPDDTQSYGLDISNDLFRVNLGHMLHPRDSDLERNRALGTVKLPEGFVGVKYQELTNDDLWSVHGGYDLTDKFTVQATTGDGGQRAVGIFRVGEGNFAVGGGFNRDGDFDANIHYTNPNVFAFLKGINSDNDLDGRLIYSSGGAVNPEIARFASSVTGSGNNEIDDDFVDVTFPFDIGNDPILFHNFFAGNTLFLGNKAGDYAIEARWKEGNRAIFDGTVRLPSFGFIRDPNIRVGAYARLEDGSFTDYSEIGGRASVGFGLGSHLDLNFNGTLDDRGDFLGAAFVGVKYEFGGEKK